MGAGAEAHRLVAVLEDALRGLRLLSFVTDDALEAPEAEVAEALGAVRRGGRGGEGAALGGARRR